MNVRDGTCVYTVEKGWGDFRSLCGVVKGGREVWEREGMKEVESGRKGWSVQHRIEKLNRVLEFCVEEDGEVGRRWGEREGRGEGRGRGSIEGWERKRKQRDNPTTL